MATGVSHKRSASLDEDPSNYASMPSGGLPDDDASSDSRSTGTGTRSGTESRDRSASKRSILPKEQDWEIPYFELKGLTRIGSGAFGEVFRARWKGVDVAVKKILHAAESDENSDIKIQDFFAEADLMRKLKPHPNITQLLGVVIHPLCIVTEFIENGSLYSWIQSKKEMTPEMKLNIIKGTAAGMLHLHSQGVVHRDLAARNILLDGALRPKVSDFGMSRVVLDNRSNSTETAVGPIKWMAPESLTNRLYSTKSDVWSFGVVIYEILTRESPYHEYNVMQIGTKVAMGTLSLVTELENTKVKYPDNVMEVFKMCLEFKAENRPEFEDIVNMLD
jgi:serine/threonine protein kinase